MSYTKYIAWFAALITINCANAAEHTITFHNQTNLRISSLGLYGGEVDYPLHADLVPKQKLELKVETEGYAVSEFYVRFKSGQNMKEVFDSRNGLPLSFELGANPKNISCTLMNGIQSQSASIYANCDD